MQILQQQQQQQNPQRCLLPLAAALLCQIEMVL